MRFVAIIAAVALAPWSAAGAPINGQPEYGAPTTGYIDPTILTYNGSRPMQCTVNVAPGSTFTEQNRATMQFAITDAATNGKWVWLPRCKVDALTSSVCPDDNSCGYSISKNTTAGNINGIDFNGLSNVTVIGYGAVLRGAGNLANTSADFHMITLRGTSHVKLIGLTYSMRDVTATGGVPDEHVHMIEIGDGTLVADDVLITDSHFIEQPTGGGGGDCIDTLGGIPVSTRTNTRINILNNTLEGCHRDGVDFERGYQFYNVAHNYFRGLTNTNQLIDNEPTSEGLIGRSTYAYNVIDRGASTSVQHMSLSGASGTSLLSGIAIEGNTFISCEPGGSLNLEQVWFHGNIVVNDLTGSGNPPIDWFRRVEDTWVSDNYFYMGPLVQPNPIITEESEGADCNDVSPLCSPHDEWIDGNRMLQYQAAPSIFLDSMEDIWVTDNDITYHGSTNGSSSFGNGDIRNDTSDADMSQWIVGNRLTRGLQSDNVTLAGKLFTLFAFTQQTGANIRHTTLRDNYIDGGSGNAGSFMYSQASTFPEGAPVVSGNVVENSATFATNGIATWRTDSSPRAESLTATGGVLANFNPFLPVTYVSDSDCDVDTNTMAAGVRDGFVKDIEVYATCTSQDTLTLPLGDGSSLTWLVTNIAPTARVELVWDATATEWWLLDATSNVTVNP